MDRRAYRYLRGRLLSELNISRRLAETYADHAASIYHLQRALVLLRAERQRPLPRAIRFLGGAQ